VKKAKVASATFSIWQSTAEYIPTCPARGRIWISFERVHVQLRL
jgi:hypothetical protein